MILKVIRDKKLEEVMVINAAAPKFWRYGFTKCVTNLSDAPSYVNCHWHSHQRALVGWLNAGAWLQIPNEIRNVIWITLLKRK